MTILKNKMFIVSILILSFFCLVSPLNAKAEEIVNGNFFESDRFFAETGLNCNGILGSTDDVDAPAYWLDWILDIIKYVAIAALLVLSTIDFIKAIISNDKDAIKKAGTTAVKRFIYCVLIFFAPILLDFLMQLFGLYGSCGLE